jgi:hydroxymethylbilane synthase
VTSPLRIGTRGSDLALWQARRVAAALAEETGDSSELVVVHTSGDRDHSRSLHELPGSGFFTKELQAALLAGSVDLVVHSLKDMPTDEPAGLAIAALLDREDPRELLLCRAGMVGDGPIGLRPGCRLGTSSLRRAAQALALQPDLVIAPLRGNVPTRLRKLRDGQYDAIMLASAGVARLALDLGGLKARRLDVDVFLPAPGQGTLAVEVRAEDHRTMQIAATLHEPEVAEATSCERALLKRLGGGCHLPLGAFAGRSEGVIRLRAVLGELDAEIRRAVVRRACVAAATADEAAGLALDALLKPAES